MIAPISPIITPSRINGILTNAFVAPIYFIMAISSRLIDIPIETVLLIRNIETASNIPMIMIDINVISLLRLVSVDEASCDCLTDLTPSNV